MYRSEGHGKARNMELYLEYQNKETQVYEHVILVLQFNSSASIFQKRANAKLMTSLLVVLGGRSLRLKDSTLCGLHCLKTGSRLQFLQNQIFPV